MKIPRKKIVPLLILAILVGLIPVLRYLAREYFQVHYLRYPDQGIQYRIDRHLKVDRISLVPVDELESETTAENGKDKIIYPGQGVGNIRFGDSEEEVRENWPGAWRGHKIKGRWFVQSVIYSKREGIRFFFLANELNKIQLIGSKECRTVKNIGLDSREEEIISVHGETDKHSGYWSGRFVNLLIVARFLAVTLILAGVLSFVSVFVVGKCSRLRVLWLSLIGYLTLAVIHLIRMGIFQYGFQLPEVTRLTIGLVIILIIMIGSLFLLAPLLVIGLWLGEKRAYRRGAGPAGKYVTAGIFILIFSAGYYVSQELISPLIYGFYLGIWLPLVVVLDFAFHTVHLAVLAPIFYLAFIQFNRLFGDESGYLVYRPREI